MTISLNNPFDSRVTKGINCLVIRGWVPAEPVKNQMSGYFPMAGKYFHPPVDSIWIGTCPKSVAAVRSSNGD